jgi:nucleoside phosphorylase
VSAPVDILIVAAAGAELAAVQLADNRRSSFRVALEAIGVGMPAAAVGTMQALAKHQPQAVILLGSCGAFRDNTSAEILTPVLPDTLKLVDAAVVLGEAAHPDVMPITAQVDRALHAGLYDAIPQAVLGAVATTSGITTSDALASRLAKESACVAENLEAIAVAFACAAYGVPFAALLVITNVVGSRGRGDWKTHFKAAALSGADVLHAWLDAGAAGARKR